MKKCKQILAIIGIILLVGLYALTIVFAFTDNSNTQSALFASIVATVIIPTLIWTYMFIYKLIHNKSDEDASQE